MASSLQALVRRVVNWSINLSTLPLLERERFQRKRSYQPNKAPCRDW